MKNRDLLAIFTGVLIILAVVPSALAVPKLMNYQGRILLGDGTLFSNAHVSFLFEILDPNRTCVIYREQVSNVNIPKGLFDVQFGKTHLFPADPLFTLHDSFDNSKTQACQNGSTYSPSANDVRVLKVQFHDGTAWRHISPDSVIGSVPYAGFSLQANRSLDADRLGGQLATNYIRKTDINGNTSCGAGDFLTWDSSTLTFGCATPSGGGGGGSSGTVTEITAGTGLSGGTINISGTIGLGGPLLGLHNMATDGYIFRNGANTYGATVGSANAGHNNLVMRDGSGVSSFYGVDLKGATSGSVLLQAADISGNYSLTLPDSQGAANQVLMTTGTTGVLAWANMPAAPGSACNSGDVLTYNGTSFVCTPDQVGSAGGGITQINGQSNSSQSLATPGTAGTAPAWSSSGGTHTLNIPMASASGVTAGLISKAQYDVFNAKLSPANNLSELTATAATVRTNLGLGNVSTLSTGTTDGSVPLIGVGDKLPSSIIPSLDGGTITNAPAGNIAATTVQAAIVELDNEKVSKTGDTMTGALTLPANGLTVGSGQLIVDGGKVGVGVLAPSAKLDVAGAIQISYDSEACAVAGDAGTLRYNAGAIQFCDGSSWQSLGIAGSGLTSLNSQSGSSQSFGTPGTAGTAPNWSSAANVHTLHIPLASASSVTAGLLSHADYSSMMGKQDALGFTPLNPANNLSELTSSASTARNNLGLGTVATLNTGTTNGAVPVVGVGDKLASSLIPNIAGTTVINTPSGSIASSTVQAALNELDTEKVAKAGDTMTGTLNLPANGLVVGINQLVVESGQVGIGTANPGATLDVKGTLYLSGATSGFVGFAPHAVAGSTVYTLPATDGSSGQVLTTDGAGSLSWTSASTPPAAVIWTMNQSTAYSGLANTLAALGDNSSSSGAATNSGTNQYISLTADQPVTVSSVFVQQFDPGWGANYTNGLEFQYYNGSAWVTLVTVSGLTNNAVGKSFSFSAVTASSFRLFKANGYAAAGEFVVGNSASNGYGVSYHASLSGLGNDDHTQYTMLAGRSGGQNIRGGTAASDGLILESTSHATKGFVLIQPQGGNVGIGVTSPTTKLDIAGAIKISYNSEPCAGVGDAGTLRYQSGAVEFCDGSAWQSLGAGGSASFATPGTTGTAPNWSSVANLHTLHIPLASASGVTAGLVSYVDYTTMMGKQNSLGFVPLNPANNLSELLLSATTARANLGLGTAATFNTGTTDGSLPIIGLGDKLSASLIPNIAGTNITNTPAGGITATTVQAALNELDNKKVSKSGDTMTGILNLAADGLIAGTNQLVLVSGAVGVGTATPTAKLEIAGQARSISSTGAAQINNLASVNWNNGNAQSLSVDCATTTFDNMLDGGTYVLAITETGTSTCTFSQAGLSFYYNPVNGPRTSGKRTVYSFQRIGNDVYVSWIAGFQP